MCVPVLDVAPWPLVVLALWGVAILALYFGWALPKYKRSGPKHLSPTSHRVKSTAPAFLRLSTVEVSERLRRGEFRSEDLVDQLIRHIDIVNAPVNAVVFKRYDEARREARAADAILKKYRAAFPTEAKSGVWRDPAVYKMLPAGDRVGWLCGVPCTIKECFAVTGCPQTSGHPKRAHYRAPEDAAAVARLRQAGAVVLGVTNTSELCMWMESSNTLYGTTCNPYDLRRIVGGSSGGEGAAVAAMFGCFGLGSDIGGSIRLPSYFNGVFGHKPSTRLVPNRGQYPCPADLGHFLLSTGPIARQACDLYPLLQTMASGGFLEDPRKFPPCPSVARPPSAVDLSRVTIYCVQDMRCPLVPVCGPQRRAAVAAAEAVACATGCAVRHVDFARRHTVPKGWHRFRWAFKVWSTLISRDSNSFTQLMAEGNNEFSPRKELWKWLKGESEHTLPALGLCLLEKVDAALTSKAAEQSWMKFAEQLRHDLEAALGDDGVLILPTYPDEVPIHHQPVFLPLKYVYTAVFNALQTPATAVPIWLPPDEYKSRHFKRQRLPLGVQCVAGWGNDHLCLAVAEALDKAFNGCYRPPEMVA